MMSVNDAGYHAIERDEKCGGVVGKVFGLMTGQRHENARPGANNQRPYHVSKRSANSIHIISPASPSSQPYHGMGVA